MGTLRSAVCLIMNLLLPFAQALLLSIIGAEGENVLKPVNCAKYTTKTITITTDSESIFTTAKDTSRCVAHYKTHATCDEMIMTCNRFFLPNKDPFMCRRGDTLYTKADGSQPKVYCDHRKPIPDYPVIANSTLKVWYIAKKAEAQMYPDKGATCTIKCK